MVLEYGLAILALIGLEILLSGDNAIILGVMAKHLPKDQQKKALRYGLIGAFVFRFACFFFIAQLFNYWQIMAVGAAYLLFLGARNIGKALQPIKESKEKKQKIKKTPGLWGTVVRIELMDMVFAVDSILASIAFAVSLPKAGWGEVGGLDGGQFLVIIIGGFAGIIAIRFAAGFMIELLNRRPGLETTAYGLIFLIGLKLTAITLAHPKVAIIGEHVPHSTAFQLVFWGLMGTIALSGWFFSGKKAAH